MNVALLIKSLQRNSNNTKLLCKQEENVLYIKDVVWSLL